MDARGVTITMLAQYLGITRTAVYNSMSKTSGLEHYWVKIAAWQKLSLDWLLAGEASVAPVELIDATGSAAMKDTAPICNGIVLTKDEGDTPVECYSAVIGQRAGRTDDVLYVEVRPNDLFALDQPSDEHLNDSRHFVSDGDVVRIIGNDGSQVVGRVKIDTKRKWYVVTSWTKGCAEKTSVWTDSDIRRIDRVPALLFTPHIRPIAKESGSEQPKGQGSDA